VARAPAAGAGELPLALALAGLLAGASLSLARLYEEGRWLLPTWLTIVAALVLGALLRRARLGSTLSLVAMAAGFIVVGGNLLFADTVFWGLPTPATLEAMREATRTALTGVVEQAAPVASSREFLLLTCAGTWAVAVSAEGLAFRAAQPLLAIVPALGLFVFPAMIRPASPGWYTLWFLLGSAGLLLYEGRARLAGWGVWVASPHNRPGGRWRLPLTPANSTGRRLALGAGALALTVPWVLPGYGGQPLLDYRGDAGPTASIAVNPFVSLKPNLVARGDVRLFTVRSDRASYWRLITLDRFDGTTWVPEVSQPTQRFTGNLGGEVEPGAPVQRLEQEFRVARLGGTWLPAAASPTEVSARPTVLVNAPNRGITIRGRWRAGFEYSVVSVTPSPTAAELRRPQAYDSPELRRYLELPADLDPTISRLADEVAGNRPTVYDSALALQDWLRASSRFTYDLDVPELRSGQDQLVRFLTQVRHGYCEQFAAAMAVMARSLGIPARVAVGFTPGVLVDGSYQVTANDAHAWPELYFSGVGWIRFEPTPRADQVSDPAWTVPAGRGLTATTTATTTAPGATATTTAPNGRRPPQEQQQGQGGGDAGGGGGALVWRLALVAVGLLVLGALVPAAKGTRHLLSRRRARDPRAAVRDAWLALADWLGDAGYGRRPAETPARWARRVGGHFPVAAGPLASLTAGFVAAEYGQAQPPPEQAGQARELAGQARTAVAAELGWARRLRAALSLASLLRGGRVRRWKRRRAVRTG
jgi:transglutaminase-like putative cysteine protease